MPAISHLVYASLALGTGPLWFFRAFQEMRLKQLIQNTSTARIRSMPMGLVELQGNVVPRSMVTAPFSGQPCVYWEVDISTRTRKNAWSVVHRNQSGQPFFLRDDTGLVLVYPQGARGHVRHGVEETCLGITLPECYAHYMDEQKLAFRHVWRLSMLRFRERRIDENQQVFVLGTAEPRPQVMSMGHDEEVEAVATGTDGGRATRLRELTRETAGVIRRGQHERAFFISQQSERELTLELGLRAWGGLIAGPVLTLFGIGMWLYALSSGRLFH